MAACVHAQPCQPGQKHFGNSCYKLLTEAMTWDEGNQACSDMGGILAVPDSSDEHWFIWNMHTTSGRGGSVWTGCNDKKEEGRWMQAGNGLECSYLEWAPNEPYISRVTNCVQMWHSMGGLFDDAAYYWSVNVICEFPAMPNITCKREYTGSHFTVDCLTSHFIKDLPAKIPLIKDLVSQGQPQWRSLNLRHEHRGEKICHLNQVTEADEKVDQSCFYFYF